MASENLTMELWEIIQNNNQEEISYNDFEKDLNKAFNLPKDEIDRALAIMISQAEVNPNIIGEYKGGSFVISQSLTANITSTIKYENQFIPGKQEYTARENGDVIVADVATLVMLGIAPAVVDKMIENYANLSRSEKNALWDNFPELDSNRRSALRRARENDLLTIVKDEKQPQNVRDMANEMRKNSVIEGAISKAAAEGSELAVKSQRAGLKKLLESNSKAFSKIFPELVGKDLDELSDEEISRHYLIYEKICIKLEDEELAKAQAQMNRNENENYYNPYISNKDGFLSNKLELYDNFRGSIISLDELRQCQASEQLYEQDFQEEFIMNFSKNLSKLDMSPERLKKIIDAAARAMQKVDEKDISDANDITEICEIIKANITKDEEVSIDDLLTVFGGQNADIVFAMIKKDKNLFSTITLEGSSRFAIDMKLLRGELQQADETIDLAEIQKKIAVYVQNHTEELKKGTYSEAKRASDKLRETPKIDGQDSRRIDKERRLEDEEMDDTYQRDGEDILFDEEKFLEMNSMLGYVYNGGKENSTTVEINQDFQEDREHNEGERGDITTQSPDESRDEISQNGVKKIFSSKRDFKMMFKTPKDISLMKKYLQPATRKRTVVRHSSQKKFKPNPEMLKKIATRVKMGAIREQMAELRKIMPVRGREEVEADLAELGDN